MRKCELESHFSYLHQNVFFFLSILCSGMNTRQETFKTEFECNSFSWREMRLNQLVMSATNGHRYDDDDCRAGGLIRIGRGNQSSLRKPAPVTPVQHNSTWPELTLNWGFHGGKTVTALATARLYLKLKISIKYTAALQSKASVFPNIGFKHAFRYKTQIHCLYSNQIFSCI
jgi:hypothetical protein